MKVLIVVDMQNDFIDGALGTKEAAAIVDNVRKKIDQYLENGDAVLYTRDTHTEQYLQTQEGRNLPVVHCVKGTFGWEISEKVYAEGCTVVDKPSFGSLILPEAVRKAAGQCAASQSGDMAYKDGLSDAIGRCQSEGREDTCGQNEKAEEPGEPESIELVGLCTDICVISNAMILKVAFPEVPIAVDASCCAGVTPESHENALNAMRVCQIQVKEN